MVFGYFVLPETVTDAIRRPFELRRANPLGALKNLTHLPGLGRLMTIYFLYSVAFTVYPSVWAYFTREKFGWEAGMVGVSLAAFGISMAIVQGGLIRVILPRLGEYRTVLFGLSFNIVALILIAMIPNGWVVLALTPLTALGAVATPAIQGIMSKTALDDQQGELQGVLTSIGALAMIVSPLLMTRIFAIFTEPDAPIYQPGAPFLLSAALVLACLPIFLTGAPKRKTS